MNLNLNGQTISGKAAWIVLAIFAAGIALVCLKPEILGYLIGGLYTGPR